MLWLVLVGLLTVTCQESTGQLSKFSKSPYAQNEGKTMEMSVDRTPKYKLKSYEPNWESLDTRPLPGWYDEAKFGIFIHWGVFSVPSFGSEWFWSNWKGNSPSYVKFMNDNYPPRFTYADFAPQFTAEFYDAKEWAKIFNNSGAQYIVLTSKHHEGYTLWPSKYSWNWNSQDVGPRRDLVGELAVAVRNYTNIKFGLYHSMYEWFHPLYLKDKANNFTTRAFVDAKTMPELIELVNTYQPEVIWSDGDWEPRDSYWKSTEFLAWLYNESPVKDTIVVNDRWGSEIPCHHGDFYTCTDHYNPGVLQVHKWENCMTVDKHSWGYRRNAPLADYHSIDELLVELVETVSCGGNLLLNVGPTHDGLIGPIFEERLTQIGQWLQVNGEAIYASNPWIHQNDTVNSNVWYTAKMAEDTVNVYALVLAWPGSGNDLLLGAPIATANTQISLLGYDKMLQWKNSSSGGIQVSFPPLDLVKSRWVWTLKMVNLAN